MEEATYLAVGLIVLEILWRIYECPNITFEYIQTTGFEPFLWWIVAYLLCIGMVLLEVKNLPFFQSKFVRNSIKILHALDGLIALVVGMAYYYENNTLLAIGILCITKFFLLHLLSRMVTGVKAFSKWSVIVQTTKTFIHHTASFYFLAAGLSVERLSNTILLTALWRSISMTGHAVLALRAQTADDGWEGFTLTEKTYDRWTWNISHLRNAMIVVVLVSCYYDHHIRRGFALSAAGHVAYMVVRAIPVFRIASQYFPNPQEREQWENLTDAERLKKLRQGENPWLALELSLMFICSIVLLYLRATMTLIVDYDTCTFA